MDKQKIKDTIIKILSLTDKKLPEDRIDNLVEELVDLMDTKDIMDALALKATNIYQNDNKKLLQSLEIIRELDPTIYPDWKGLLETAEINKATNHRPGDLGLKENHQLIDETLVEVCNKLNASRVDYYVVGALSSFIGTGTPLFRYHEDIDFMVAEEDLDKVRAALEGTDYVFEDNRLHNKKIRKPGENHTSGEHEVIAHHKANEFHLGFFLFKRNPDNSLTIREYYMENGEPQVLERHMPKELVDLEYNSKTTEYKGTRFRTSTPESVYAKKLYTRHEKDLLDISNLRKKIDQTKIDEAKKYQTTVTTHPVNPPKKDSVDSMLSDGASPMKSGPQTTMAPAVKGAQKTLGVHPAMRPATPTAPASKPSGFVTIAASLLIVILVLTIVLLLITGFVLII